jgi:5-methylcytosine-specific restriction endonuclease McrA
MVDAVRQLVHRRAAGRCEYCHLPEAGHEERFSIDHIIASQHHEDDSIENLALSCLRCNLHKGTNLSGLDPSDRDRDTLSS